MSAGEDKYAFVAQAPKCGCVALIIADDPARIKANGYAELLLDAVRDGCEIHRYTLKEYREKIVPNMQIICNKDFDTMIECIRSQSA